MNISNLSTLLGWTALINYGILIFWFIAIISFRDTIFRLHSRWFSITREEFDRIHYGLMGVFKLLIFIFTLVPFLVIEFILG